MLRMPEPDQNTLARRKDIIAAMRDIIPTPGGVIVDDDQLRPYECDGLMAYRQLPMIVVLPENTEQVAAILKYCHTNKIRVVPRGAGTGLSGGALPMADAITISMMKFNRVLDIDWDNRAAVVQPGVTNLGITRAVEHEGFITLPIHQARSRAPSGEYRRKFRRGALPEIRAYHQQCVGCRNGHHRR